MDACEILKMEGYVSALDEEPDGEESPPSADAAQAHSPKPEIVNHVALPAHATQNVFFALPAHATQDEILNAMLLWDMPLETYPAKILDAKLKWYIDVPAVSDADPVTVDLQRQAFVVGHIDGNYYSFGNSDEFPLGQVLVLQTLVAALAPSCMHNASTCFARC